MGLKIISPNTVYLGSATGSGGGGGGSSSLPIIVKNSGSSLPSATTYSIGDKFLQTNEKKIYTPVINGYIANSGVTNNNLTIDYNTAIATGWGYQKSIRREYTAYNIWKQTTTKETLRIKFKLKTLSVYNSMLSIIFGAAGQSTYIQFGVNSNNQVYHNKYSFNYGSYSLAFTKTILDTVLSADIIYILNIERLGTDCKAQLTLEDGTLVEEKEFTTELVTQDYSMGTSYGGSYDGTSHQASSDLEVFLADSYGNILVPNTSTLSWDNGTDLVNNTEYADKTNEILYIYENNELLAINKPNSFAQITGQPSDNSNLATALNNKQNKALSFTNKSASSWVSDSTYTDYGYKCELSCSGVTSSMYAMVNFAPTEADSGNYATVCLTGNGTVTIYSKVNDTITIPSIVVMGV